MIALPCVTCGGQTCIDMEPFGRSKEQFLRRFMTLEHGIPSHGAVSALFGVLDPDCLGRAPLRLAADWAERLGPDLVAIDGKSHEITAKGGACVLALKGNQERRFTTMSGSTWRTRRTRKR